MNLFFKQIFLTLIITFLCFDNLYSQDTLSLTRGAYRETALFSGYAFNFGNTTDKNSHIVEIGVWKTKYITHIEPVNSSIYFANDFLLHDSKLILGPKVGGYIGFWTICLGAELICYTDFNESAFRLAPYFGFGSNRAKLTFKPLIKLSNRDFGYVNSFCISFSIQIKSLKKSEM